PTANSLDVIKQVREAIPGIRAQLPAGMKVGIPYDSTAYIQDAIKEVLSTLTETLLIVIVVIFLFLGSFRSVLIPVVAIPIALFREFAFTLAGAVLVSGIVALTLSPMMGSKLLRAGDTERGFSGWINRRFESVRSAYGRLLTGTLQYRPVVLTVWVIVVLLVV